MTTDYIRKLTKAQRDTLIQISFNNDLGHSPRVIKALLDDRLIMEHEEKHGGYPPLIVKRYTVPFGVHIDVCQYCDEVYDNEPASTDA